MDEMNFWSTSGTFVSAVMNTVDRLSKNSYIFIVNLWTNLAWCSMETQEYFELGRMFVSDVEHEIASHVHPYDLEEYQDGIRKRMRGEDLDGELCIRFREKSGDYCMYSFHTDIVKEEEPYGEYLIVILKNENVLPLIDALTDLYSQVRYSGDLEHAIKTEEQIAVLKIGIRQFNNFNIIYGEKFTNQILRETALQFIYQMDENSAVYRMDGAKFAFILKKCGRDQLVEFEHKIRKLMDEAVFVENEHVSLKICAGAILLEKNQEEAASVISKVSYALSHSEHEHQGNLVIFNDEVRTARSVNLDLIKVIHQSVRDGCLGFYVEYQPIVDAGQGDIVGAEALVRWSREPYGIVPPGMFIEWMETDPSMYELGNFVLETALAESKHLLGILPGFFVNVNVSARQMERKEFRQAVQDILEKTEFPADHLCLELTERCKDLPISVIKREVEFFRGLGIRLAMDDYGTGSASSSIVMNVPMDEVKLDMSFIRGITDNPKNQAMVQSIVDFANKTGMSTCLEGVENEELQNYLRTYNATWFQGYYYSKPISITQLEELINKQPDR